MSQQQLQSYFETWQANLSLLPGAEAAWLNTQRKNALDYFLDQGFPSRADEDWKYTNVEAIRRFPFSIDPSHKADSIVPSLASDHWTLVMRDGQVHGAQETQDAIGQGLIVCSLSDALAKHEPLVRQYLNQCTDPMQHAFSALNTAFMQQGLFIHVPPGVVIDKPLVLKYRSEAAKTYHYRNLIVVSESAQLSMIEAFVDDSPIEYSLNTITECALLSAAKFEHVKFQNQSQCSFHIGSLEAKLQRDSCLTSHSIALGGKLVRSDTVVGLLAPGSECKLNGLYSLSGQQHIDHHTQILHQAKNCRSDEYYKGIVSEKANAVFNGRVYVEKEAFGTQSCQQNKNLLLNQGAQVDTKPQLEIFADDVQCAHGATVGYLDEQAIFYLRSRGIDEIQAHKMMINAFARDIIDVLPWQFVRDEALQEINKRMSP